MVPVRARCRSATGPRTFANCSWARSISAGPDDRRSAKGQYISNPRLLHRSRHVALQRAAGVWQHRAGAAFSSNINYTLSKCTGFPSQGGSTPNVASGYMIPVPLINTPANGDALLDQDKGPCDWDRRHVFNATRERLSPERGACRRRWRLSGILRAYSGGPFSVTTGTDAR
jgi:hypothetical protein